MYDKFDSPGSGDDFELYEKSPVEKVKEAIGPAKDFLKANWKKILAGIIALAILLFVYDFFIGSYREISFDVIDTEGDSISATIKLYDSEGEEIGRLRSGETISLKTGDYRVNIAATDYKAISQQVSVSQDGPITQKMQIDRDLELDGELPETIYTSQEISTTLAVTNKDNEPVEIELVLDGDFAAIASLEYDKPFYALPGREEIPVVLKIKQSVDGKYVGGKKNGEIRIMGLDMKDATVSAEYTLIELDEGDIKIKFGSSKTNADFGRVKTGETAEKEINFENETDEAITGIEVELTITSPGIFDADEIKDWFTYEPSNTIASVGSGQTEIINVTLRIPEDTAFTTGKEEEVVSGYFSVKTTYFERKFNLDLTVRKTESEISVDGLGTSYYLEAESGSYESVTDILTVKNSGKSTLTNFDLVVVCNPVNMSWLYLEGNTDQYSFNELVAGQEKNIQFSISVPNKITAGTTTNCKLRVSYDEPSGIGQSVEKLVLISTE